MKEFSFMTVFFIFDDRNSSPDLYLFFTEPLHAGCTLWLVSSKTKRRNKMKKTLVIVALVVTALAILGVSAVFAQDVT
ncbi:MAG TPA: hypothetical protein PLL95_04475, partial [Anaerolineales bacterium]|nr:hypothetical protein [Anaerolineales bacterium]